MEISTKGETKNYVKGSECFEHPINEDIHWEEATTPLHARHSGINQERHLEEFKNLLLFNSCKASSKNEHQKDADSSSSILPVEKDNMV